MQAALEQLGIHLSRATCGRVMAMNRKVYGLQKPKGPARLPKEMPFHAHRRHQYWSTDIRYIDNHRLADTGNVYAISILENYSRAILWSSLTTTQDLASYLLVLYRAVERYGSPEALISDSGSVFLANRAKALYAALGIATHEIEKGKPYQNYSETTFNIQRRMADHYFAEAESWEELVVAHDRWVEDYNAQRHFAHEDREDGRRSPVEVLSFLSGLLRYHSEDLKRAFSRQVSPGSSILWGMPGSCTGECTVKKGWRNKKPRCGSMKRLSLLSTRGKRWPATTSSSRWVLASCERLRGRCYSRLPTSEAGRN